MSPRRRVPSKAELIQYQRLYKTDETIGERLGVPAYLVAYWRRKKNVPRHSLPKFSDHEIRNLWERFGDDERCGLELGISKAAFYNWRRKYGFREKPPFLKLEQLELPLAGVKGPGRAASLYGKQTIAQKILARATGRERVETGELVVVEPDVVMSQENSGEVIRHFKELGVEYVWNPNRIVISLSSCGHRGDNDLSAGHKTIREFVRRQNVRTFYDIQEGTCHQMALERGNILPGQLCLGADRHATLYGAVGAFATGIEAREMAVVWGTGKVWLSVPRTLRIDVIGRRPSGVSATEIALSIITQLGVDGAEYKAIEYYGSVVSQMSVSERATLAHLSVEMGAKAAICSYEAITRRYLVGRTQAEYTAVLPDKDAEYEGIFQTSVERLVPQVAGPNGFSHIRAAAELEGLAVQQVVVGGVTGGCYGDLRTVAEILRERTVHPDCRLWIVPASRSVYLEALQKGLMRLFMEAGAIVTHPGGSISVAGDNRLPASGERCLTTANWFHPQARSADKAEMYLCSAATAAASALNAAITDPVRYLR